MSSIKINIPNPRNVFNKKIFEILYDYRSATEVHYGGASSGKSHGVVQKVVYKAISNWKHPRKVLFLRKVATTIKDSIFEDVQACLSDFGILEHCKINHTDYRITLPNKAVFIFKGMDNPEKVKSIKGVSDIVMEEATEFTLDDYTQLTLRVREKKHKFKQIFLMFNPVSKLNWVFKYFFETSKVDEDIKIIHSTYKDNNFLDDSVRNTLEMLSDRNPAYYKIYALGDFATLDKLVFPKFTKKLLSREKLSHLPSYFGLDFGYTNDPSAFIHLKVDETNKRIYFIEEYARKGMLNDRLYETIDSLGYRKEVITADCARPETIADLQRLGISRIRASKKGPDSVISGIQFLKRYDFIVDERCVKLIEELENYTWRKNKKSGEYENQPVDSYNHLLDAIRYAVEHMHNSVSVKFFEGGL